MANINLLHLSDLHISSKRLSSTSKELIDDIVSQIEDMSEVILVVSGDTVNKGEFEKYMDGVQLFFQSLKDKTGKKIKDVYFVPGNHDKVRSKSNELFGKYIQYEPYEMTEEVWNLQSENYADYLNMVNVIKKIFNSKSRNTTCTFGVEYCETKGGIICIVKIDTSWATYGGKEEGGKLIIGKYQFDKLRTQYSELKDKLEEKEKELTITIGIGHHPVNWLQSSEEKEIKKYMIDEEYFNMNLYLCGHIHDMDVENWNNGYHSIMTLVTGIGWNHQDTSSKEKDKKDEHRYSLYIIDKQKNSCDIIMRRSQKNGKFVSDYSVYTNDEEKKDKLCYPLVMDNSRQPFINMNAPKGDFISSMFVDTYMINSIKEMQNQLVAFQKKVVELLIFYEREYVEEQKDLYESEEYLAVCMQLNDRFFKKDYVNPRINEIFSKEIERIYRKFTGYLYDVLVNFVTLFQDCFPENTNIRAHFRWYNQDGDKYIRLCQYSNIDGEDGPNLSSIDWGGMIEQSYKTGNSLVYSINQKYNNHKPVKWDDFLTAVPLFFRCEQEIRDTSNRKRKRPMITFGISVLNEDKNKDISKYLYILEYLGISQLITSILDDFMRDFDVDYTQYLKYIDFEINQGE